MIAFIVVSALLLVLVRPIAKKHLTDRTPLQLDGVETLIGRTRGDPRGRRLRWPHPHGRRRVDRPQPAERRELRGGRDGAILQVDGATAVVGDALE